MLLKTLTPLAAATLVAVSLAATGCFNSEANNPKLANQDTNFFNIVDIKPHSYAFTPPTTAELHSNDMISRPNVSGTQVSILCGLVTYDDY